MNPSLQHPLVCNVTIYKLFMNLCHMQVLQITVLWTEILNVVPGICRSRYRFLKVLYK